MSKYVHGIITLAVLAVVAAGCETIGTAAQSKTTQGALLGSALGAGTGAIIGNQSGDAGKGTAIGAGLGALAGGLVGHAMEEQEKRLQQQQYQGGTQAPQQSGQKFCPVGGETYGPEFQYCPVHGVELKTRQ